MADYQSDAAEVDQMGVGDLGYKVEFENEELAHKASLEDQDKASFFQDNLAEILVTVGALLLVVVVCFVGYTYFTRRRHHALSATESSIDVEKMQRIQEEEEKLDRRFVEM